MSILNVKIKKLLENATLPSYANNGDAGLDLIAVSEKIVTDGAINYISYGTGLSIKIPEGFVGLIFPRSSISTATTQVLSNSVGVIDSSYTGEISVRFKNLLSSGNKKYSVGDKIAQLVILQCPTVVFEEVTEMPLTDRGSQGFGSSGK